MIALEDRLRGAVWGHLVGDALGVPYEFLQPEAVGEVVFGVTGSHGQPAGTWSDDGALMLATLDSLLSHGLQVEDQGRRFLDWHRGTAYTPDGDGPFDIGRSTREALRRLADGTPAIVAGGREERDNGNGSLMRILPVALVGRELPPDELVEWAEVSSRITHQHRWSQTACAVYALAARALLAGAEPEFALRVTFADVRRRWTTDAPSPDRVDALDRLERWPTRSGRGFVFDTFWSAWDAFTGATSYEETIRRAVAYGHDTDTTACVAGGLAGIRWGIAGIPAAWLDGMRGHDLVDPLLERLAAPAG
jgi:ADP-ribosylglycohydrolase